ncbi:MAG: hypothetical protein JNM70_22665 [Anaerolineae bacterium]|nr:hypothetical protein [Anaerolineae bacterium]
MAAPEHSPARPPPSTNILLAELAVIERRLEAVDEDENPLEQELKRDRLLEASDQLQDDLATSELQATDLEV